MHPTNPFLYLQRAADADPRGIFLRTPDQSLTYAEAVVSVKKLAFELRRLGVAAGQLLALDLPDRLGILFTEAAYHEGAVTTIVPSGVRAADVVHIDWLFSSREPTAGIAERVVTVDAAFLRDVEQNPYGISPATESSDTLRIVFSSGTTGTAKAVALGRAMEQAMDHALPMYFDAGQPLMLMDTGTAWGIGEFFLSVKAGKPYLNVSGYASPAIVDLAVAQHVRVVKGSPAQLAALADELERQQRTLPDVHLVVAAGTVLPVALADRLQKVIEGGVVVSNYGSTEAGGATSRVGGSDDPTDAGHVVPGSQLQIVDDDDQQLLPGEQGRIRYRSPGMVHEYLGDPAATARAFKGGWFYPGDLGLIRDDGGLTLLGRETEILNAGGVKVDPNRIDQFTAALPGVVDACSFGFDTRAGTTGIGLALVTEHDVDVHRIVDAVKAEFASASPTLIARVDSVPRGATGKPLRRELAARFAGS